MTASASQSLLSQLLKLTIRKEDFITECVAAVLRADVTARHQHWRLLTHGKLAALPPEEIRTQCDFGRKGGRGRNDGRGRTSARCDLVLRRDRYRVAVEHKLFAAQGHEQLERYLALPRREVSHVAFVAADYQRISDRVLNNPRFLQPRTGPAHFVWGDVYPIIARSAERGVEVAQATRSLFDDLGLQPAHPLVGQLNTRDPERRSKLDARMHAAWQPLLKTLVVRGWGVQSSGGSSRQCVIFATRDSAERLGRVWLDPISNPGSLRVRLYSRRRDYRDEMLDRLTTGRPSIPGSRSLSLLSEPAEHKRIFPWSVEIRVPWRVLLQRASPSTMPSTLRTFVLELMRVADSRSM